MLSNEAKEAIRLELLNDPAGVGYNSYLIKYQENQDINAVRAIVFLLHSNYRKTRVKKIPMRDFMNYIKSPSLGVNIENRNVIFEMIKRIPSSGGTVSLEEINNLSAHDLLNFLDYYGPEIMLQTFGCMDYTHNEAVVFGEVTRTLLSYIVSRDGLVDQEFVDGPTEIPRINICMLNIVNAPNTVTEIELIDVLNSI